MTVYHHSDRQQPPTLWWKWKCPSLSRVQLFAVPWTVARQTPLSTRLLQARILEWITILFSGGSSPPRDWTQVSCIADSLHKSDHSNINWMRPMEEFSEHGGYIWWVYLKWSIKSHSIMFPITVWNGSVAVLFIQKRQLKTCYKIKLSYCFNISGFLPVIAGNWFSGGG